MPSQIIQKVKHKLVFLVSVKPIVYNVVGFNRHHFSETFETTTKSRSGPDHQKTCKLVYFFPTLITFYIWRFVNIFSCFFLSF